MCDLISRELIFGFTLCRQVSGVILSRLMALARTKDHPLGLIK
jgi:hypothetical protein